MSEFSFKIIVDNGGGDPAEMAMQGLAAIEAAIAINIMYFNRHPEDICALACGMVKYDSAKKTLLDLVGDIETAPILIKKGYGLCIAIVAFDVAAKRFEGYNAWPVVIDQEGGYFHVITEMELPDGSVVQLDPSSELERIGIIVEGRSPQCFTCRI